MTSIKHIHALPTCCLCVPTSLALCRFLPCSKAGSGPADAPARPLVRCSHSSRLDCIGASSWVNPWRGIPMAHC
eukprot:3823602-Pleurochrysis_carterae.AAC.3